MAVTALILVATLAFGAVHPSVYWPVGVATLALSAWLAYRSQGARINRRSFALPLLLLVPPLLQTTPLPRGMLDTVAPANTAFIRSFEVGFDASRFHSLSVAPLLTLTSCAFLLTGLIWTGALSSALARQFRPRDLLPWIVGAAVTLALFAVIQSATFNAKIYWVWESRFNVPRNYFGPFVNRNHFAGWMILALSISAGFFLGLLSSAARRVKPGWRSRVLWLGSEEASGVLTMAMALLVMSVSLVWSLSRSGIAGGALALLLLGICSTAGAHSSRRRLLGPLSMAVLLCFALGWKGLPTLLAWYQNTRTIEWRLALWHDSLAPLADFVKFGSGLNTYGAVMLLYPESDLTQHAQQAHNDYLQLAIEGGVLVVIPWIIAAIALVRRIAQRLRQPQDEMTWWIRAGAVSGLCGLAVQEISDFSLQIPAVALMFGTVVALAIHPPPLSGTIRRRA